MDDLQKRGSCGVTVHLYWALEMLLLLLLRMSHPVTAGLAALQVARAMQGAVRQQRRQQQQQQIEGQGRRHGHRSRPRQHLHQHHAHGLLPLSPVRKDPSNGGHVINYQLKQQQQQQQQGLSQSTASAKQQQQQWSQVSHAMGAGGSSASSSPAVLDRLRLVPGNRRCADCGAADLDWASLNLGISDVH